MDGRTEMRDFLVSRRGRITPEQAGIETYGDRRRVTGLRREEVARLAGVSVDYFTKVERGNLRGVSDSVLDAIARALQLDDAEREHLFDLARATGTGIHPSVGRTAPRQVPLEVQYMLDAVTDAPAMVGNNRMDVVAANQLGYAMYSPMFAGGGTANHSRFIFLDPRSEHFYPDWHSAATVNVALLRREAGRSPHDRLLSELVGELSVRSEVFRTLWAAHHVRHHYTGRKQFMHPVVGLLELNFVAVELGGAPGLHLTTYPATPGSVSAESLRLLASWAANESPAESGADSDQSRRHPDPGLRRGSVDSP